MKWGGLCFLSSRGSEICQLAESSVCHLVRVKEMILS